MDDAPPPSDTPATGSGLAVSVVVSRRPAPGREQDLIDWAHAVSRAASAFPGHLGAQVYPPDPPNRSDLVIAFSFDTAEHLSAWERSDERREWLERSRPFTVGDQRSHAVGGFESLFAPGPGVPVTPPPKWKTAIIIATALYPASLLLNWLLAPAIAAWPLPLRVLVTTLLIVPWMTWLGVPYLSRWLRGWLRPAAPPKRPAG